MESAQAERQASYRVRLRVLAAEILRAADAAQEELPRTIKYTEDMLRGSQGPLNETQRQVYQAQLKSLRSQAVPLMYFEGFYQTLRGLLDEMKAADIAVEATQRLLEKTRGVWVEPKPPANVTPHWETDVVKVRAFARHLQAVADKLK